MEPLPSPPGFDHGPRLSGEEYDRRVVELHSGLPPAPSRAQEQAAARRELDLAIDHRLGRDFPRERRDALWEVRRRVQRRRLRLMLRHLLRRLWPAGLARGAQGLAGFVVEEYGTVLSEPELEAFFGREEVRNPGLPIDVDSPG